MFAELLAEQIVLVEKIDTLYIFFPGKMIGERFHLHFLVGHKSERPEITFLVAQILIAWLIEKQQAIVGIALVVARGRFGQRHRNM